MGEHGKDGNHQPDDLKQSAYDSNTIFMTQNTLFVNQMTQNTLLYSIYGTAEQILTYVLPYSAKKQVFLVFGLFCPEKKSAKQFLRGSLRCFSKCEV